MKKLFILFLSLSVCLILTACGTADKKVEGKWIYKYADFQNINFVSDKDDMYVEAKGVRVDVIPLKDASNNKFRFLLETKKGNYIYNVELADDEHLVITPEPEDKASLPERLVSTDNINKKTKQDRSITFKKVE